MDQDQLRFDVAALLEQRQRAIDLAQASLRREHELFQYWLDDPKNDAKYRLWKQQKKATEYAITTFAEANTKYAEACVRSCRNLSEKQHSAKQQRILVRRLDRRGPMPRLPKRLTLDPWLALRTS